jgi:hypothetical protein
MKPTIEQLALVLILDGKSEHDIKSDTGLSSGKIGLIMAVHADIVKQFPRIYESTLNDCSIPVPFAPVSYYCAPDLFIQNRDPENRFPDKASWVVTRHGSTLNQELKFEYEPMPSHRDEDYLKRTRFTLEAAVSHAKAVMAKSAKL